MELHFGISANAQELTVEIAEDQKDQVMEQVEAALRGDIFRVELTDTKGAKYLVGAKSITYVRMTDRTTRRVGFEL